MKKKVSIPITITIALLAAAIAFSAAFFIARASFNKDLEEYSEWQAKSNEWQAKYGTLSEVDKWVRENFEGTIDEEKLNSELCKAYADAIGEEVIYVKAADFDEAKYKDGENCVTYKLSNEDFMVIMK